MYGILVLVLEREENLKMKNKIRVILCAFLLVLSSVFTNMQANEESVVTQTENHEKAQTFEAVNVELSFFPFRFPPFGFTVTVAHLVLICGFLFV